MGNGMHWDSCLDKFSTLEEERDVIKKKVEAKRNMDLIENKLLNARNGETGYLRRKHRHYEGIYLKAVDRIVNAYQPLLYAKVAEYSRWNSDLPREEIESDFNSALHAAAKKYMPDGGACFYTLFNRFAYHTLCGIRKRHMRTAQRVVSLDAGDSDNWFNAYESIEDERANSPFEDTSTKSSRDFLSESMRVLTKRERYIIENRFGINDGVAKTLEEVGDMIGLTRERVRQLGNIALKKLREAIKRRLILEGELQERKDFY